MTSYYEVEGGGRPRAAFVETGRASQLSLPDDVAETGNVWRNGNLLNHVTQTINVTQAENDRPIPATS